MINCHKKGGALVYLMIGCIQLNLFGEGAIFSESQLWEEVDETKPLALVFYSTQCPIASRYLPLLERSKQSDTYGKKSQIYLVFSNQDEDEERVAKYLEEMKVSLPAVIDGEARLAQRWGAEVTPELAVLEAKGSEWQKIYGGKIDDRYEELGRFRPKARVNFLERALEAAVSGDTSELVDTKAIGCYIYNDRLRGKTTGD